MTQIISYLIEANICLLILGTVYFLLLANETNFRFKRYFLLAVCIIALLTPFLHFNLIPTQNQQGLISQIQSITTLPELIIGYNQPVTSGESYSFWSLQNIIVITYMAITLSLLVIFMYRVSEIMRFKRAKHSSMARYGQYDMVYTDGQLPTFAFLNTIFYDNTATLTLEEAEKILKHEAVHLRQGHTFDIILIELMKAILWVNPMGWFIKKHLTHIHEYLADASILLIYNANDYSRVLAKVTLTQIGLPIGHHFNKSMTLKRIKMMKSPKRKLKDWKWVSSLAALAMIILVFSCNDVNDIMQTASQKELPAELEQQMIKLQSQYPNAEFVYLETDAENKEKLERLGELNPKAIAYTKEWEDTGMIGIIVSKSGEMSQLQDADGAYWIVDETATPEGGFEAMYADLGQNLK